jgi:hypothetical protein
MGLAPSSLGAYARAQDGAAGGALPAPGRGPYVSRGGHPHLAHQHPAHHHRRDPEFGRAFSPLAANSGSSTAGSRRAPDLNAFVERFEGTRLHDHYRIAFRHRYYTSGTDIEADSQSWLCHDIGPHELKETLDVTERCDARIRMDIRRTPRLLVVAHFECETSVLRFPRAVRHAGRSASVHSGGEHAIQGQIVQRSLKDPNFLPEMVAQYTLLSGLRTGIKAQETGIVPGLLVFAEDFLVCPRRSGDRPPLYATRREELER